MKKLLLLAAIIGGTMSYQAQETTTENVRQNDVMISPIELIAIPLLNVSYERLINENSGVGINGMFYFGDDNADNFDEDDSSMTQISPYYRMYFGRKYASGFFVEGFVPITMTTDYYYYFNSPDPSQVIDKRTTIGIGVGFGGKWVARKNIIFEASMGIARRFGEAKYYDSSNITGKGMLGIGYRF